MHNCIAIRTAYECNTLWTEQSIRQQQSDRPKPVNQLKPEHLLKSKTYFVWHQKRGVCWWWRRRWYYYLRRNIQRKKELMDDMNWNEMFGWMKWTLLYLSTKHKKVWITWLWIICELKEEKKETFSSEVFVLQFNFRLVQHLHLYNFYWNFKSKKK